MAHLLQNDDEVTEMYVSDGNIKKSKYLLIMHKSGTLELKWCYGDAVEIQKDPILVTAGRRRFIEFGEPNIFDIRAKLPFQDENGNLNKAWEKIM